MENFLKKSYKSFYFTTHNAQGNGSEKVDYEFEKKNMKMVKTKKEKPSKKFENENA